MKKLMIAGLMVLSITALGRSYNGEAGRGYHGNTAVYESLNEDQKAELNTLRDKAYAERQKYANEIQMKKLEVERLVIEDEVDWNKVEKLNGEIAELQAEMRTESLKYRKEASDITGYDHGMGMGSRGHMNHGKHHCHD